MHSPDLLEAAGQRAAYRPVPMPPPIDELVHEADRRRTKKRRVGGALAAMAFVVSIPLGVSLVSSDQPDVVTFASENGDGGEVSESPVAVQPAETSTSTSTTTTVATDISADTGPFAGMDDENFDLSLNFGDTSISIEVITGGAAADRAAAAADAADSTRTVDDETVWLDEQGDQLSASAFFDDETFVSVTGPAEDIDRILNLVTEHANGPIQFFDPKDFTDRFDLPEGIFDDDFEFGGDFNLDLDGDGLPDNLGDLFANGTFPGVDEAAMEEFRQELDNFSECLQLEFDRSGDSATIEIPECDLPAFEGIITPGLNEFFDDDTFGNLFGDDVFDELPEGLDDLLGEMQDALKDAS